MAAQLLVAGQTDDIRVNIRYCQHLIFLDIHVTGVFIYNLPCRTFRTEPFAQKSIYNQRFHFPRCYKRDNRSGIRTEVIGCLGAHRCNHFHVVVYERVRNLAS